MTNSIYFFNLCYVNFTLKVGEKFTVVSDWLEIYTSGVAKIKIPHF